MANALVRPPELGGRITALGEQVAEDAAVLSQVKSRLMALLRESFMSWVTIFYLMRDISCNKPTQKHNPLINAFALPANENNRVVRPIGPNIKSTISSLIIFSTHCQFIIFDLAQCFKSEAGLQYPRVGSLIIHFYFIRTPYWHKMHLQQ